MWNWMAPHLFMAFNYLVIFFYRQMVKEEKPLIQQGLKRRHVAYSGFAAFDPKFLILLLSNVFLQRAWLLLILLRSGFIAVSGLSYYDYFSL
jgi:hypothetical protein